MPASRDVRVTPVESHEHDERRVNIPTADADAFVPDEVAAPFPTRWPRNTALDPQLVWRGKDGQADELEVTTPPIYIQEKIEPRALVENLRRTAARPEDEPEIMLFEQFDDLGPIEAVEYYQHASKWSNRMILGDSLAVMASLAERENLRGQVQAIYVDPPYGIKFGSNWQPRVDKRDVKDGNLGDMAREAEQIKAFRDTWEDGIHTYLTYLRDRLQIARELLTESGSIFVQIGDENVHLVRSLLDEVFGPENLVAQISVVKTSSSSMQYLDSVTDFVLWYGKDLRSTKYRPLFRLKVERGFRFLELPDGARRPASKEERSLTKPPPDGARWFEVGDITSQTDSKQSRYTVEFDGDSFPPGKRNWATPPAGMERVKQAGRLARRGESVGFVRFADDFPAVPLANNWTDTGTGSFTDPKVYVVQTGNKIIERCLLMATDPGDLVLDPTCGAGTTAYVAEQWARRWITIDTSRVAITLSRQRIMAARFPYYLLADSADGAAKERELGTPSRSIPTDHRGEVRQGFVCERVPHITGSSQMRV